MTLILLAMSAVIVFCIIAWNLAIYALPVMVALTAFQWVYATEAGIFLSGLAALGAALASVALVIAVVGLAKNVALRLVALAVFAVPAFLAGYALSYGILKHTTDSGLLLNSVGIIAGLVIGVSAIINLNALGESALSR
ncbi:hypothetical protein [Chelatococcus asaccharovorans]|jgi:hypothetical protein|uniref:hypothetical protein n=1 Tax=Chelatococcus asaccharovorans TaxID=28210 RepID=UPI00224C6B6E|nr:hypothetical protein [Chelatococcus asaccharovorans]CAH1666928.1 conserved membrane hypothetical protein [Chelatococcus asaccharovorans]CAH1681247.1 conserved membrane hypothetical protein [Chelatococcus asaccharovorans]HMR30112.1 hypothetical protein [Geminicoccus sp.]HMU50530.1 hypothetical protein [Geminicoccaceae bacterium]